MFGFISASLSELTQEEQTRYRAVYCGICRRIRSQSSNTARLSLRYDMVFLAMLLMSLYEPEETSGGNACLLHPVRHSPWIDNEYIRYAADMNVALAYYKALDDWQDDKRLSSRVFAGLLRRNNAAIHARFPRQCRTIADCISRLRTLEQEGCPDPDAPANCFGILMGELMVFREDLWAPVLRQMGRSLGRFIYLADAAIDYRKDRRSNCYNPFLAMGTGEDWSRWEQYLVLDMHRCTTYFETLPLVQDKRILDNILYSGIWIELRKQQKEQTEQTLREEKHDRRSL